MRASSRAQFPEDGADRRFFQYFFTGAEPGERVREARFRVDVLTAVSAHFALLAPDLYKWLIRRPTAFQRLALPVLQTWAKLHGGAANVVIAVAQKP